MGLATSGLNDAVTGVSASDRISAHTGNPGGTGASEVVGGSYARQTTTWGTVSNGSRVGSEVELPIPGGTTVTYWGLWSSGGTFKGAWQLSTPEAFGDDGVLAFTPTLTASAVN